MTKYEKLQSMNIEEVAWELIELSTAAKLVAMGMPKEDAICAVKAMKGTPEAKKLVKQGVAALQKEADDESEAPDEILPDH